MRRLIAQLRNAITASPLAWRPGHYYSPVCDPRESLLYYRDPDHAADQPICGIDLNKEHQLARLTEWLPFMPEMKWHRFDPARGQYSLSDATCLYCMIRELRPRRIVEIGCGSSSVCMLDTIEGLNLLTVCTFIDPAPQMPVRLEHGSRHKFLQQKVQLTERSVFEQLKANDILFIDSSHVLKTGSDLAFELFEILPVLAPGVFIHFHDVFFPFEYVRSWAIDKNWSWNEVYALRAFLMYNRHYRIEFWHDYLVKSAPEALAGCAVITPWRGNSLWLSVTPI